jgi:hypothetical protein
MEPELYSDRSMFENQAQAPENQKETLAKVESDGPRTSNFSWISYKSGRS